MNKKEAKSILDRKLKALQARSYEELYKLVDTPEPEEVKGESGMIYYLSCYAHWYDHPNKGVHVRVTIDDGSWLARFAPLQALFTVWPSTHHE